jgi:hypothetical protein
LEALLSDVMSDRSRCRFEAAAEAGVDDLMDVVGSVLRRLTSHRRREALMAPRCD